MNPENTVEITVLNGRVRLCHPVQGGFRTSLDSVLLAAACPAVPGDHVLDLGCGVGAVGLCVAARVPGIDLTGVEILADHAALAIHNAVLNNMEGRARFVADDVHKVALPQLYDHVICNPPYLDEGTYTPSPDAVRATALGHLTVDTHLEDWILAAHTHVKSRGTFTIIHRADYLDRIIQGLGRRFGATEIIPIYPRAGDAAKRVIVRTIKDRQPGCVVHPGLILHEGLGWSAAASAVLESGCKLY